MSYFNELWCGFWSWISKIVIQEELKYYWDSKTFVPWWSIKTYYIKALLCDISFLCSVHNKCNGKDDNIIDCGVAVVCSMSCFLCVLLRRNCWLLLRHVAVVVESVRYSVCRLVCSSSQPFQLIALPPLVDLLWSRDAPHVYPVCDSIKMSVPSK